jgi:hypothetical protein
MDSHLPAYETLLKLLSHCHAQPENLKSALEELFIMAMDSEYLSSNEKLTFEGMFLQTCTNLRLMS